MVDQTTFRRMGQEIATNNEVQLPRQVVDNIVTHILVDNINIHANTFDMNVIDAFDEPGTENVVLQTSVRPNPIRGLYRPTEEVKQTS